MSVTVRPYVNGGWEVDIRVQLPDGIVIRERKKAAASSKQAAQKWAESRERVLLVHGKPKPAKEDVQKIPTLKEFALRFLDGYAKANRLKPSGIASKRPCCGSISRRRSVTNAWTRSAPRTCSG
jgi:hypothetical protein